MLSVECPFLITSFVHCEHAENRAKMHNSGWTKYKNAIESESEIH